MPGEATEKKEERQGPEIKGTGNKDQRHSNGSLRRMRKNTKTAINGAYRQGKPLASKHLPGKREERTPKIKGEFGKEHDRTPAVTVAESQKCSKERIADVFHFLVRTGKGL